MRRPSTAITNSRRFIDRPTGMGANRMLHRKAPRQSWVEGGHDASGMSAILRHTCRSCCGAEILHPYARFRPEQKQKNIPRNALIVLTRSAHRFAAGGTAELLAQEPLPA